MDALNSVDPMDPADSPDSMDALNSVDPMDPADSPDSMDALDAMDPADSPDPLNSVDSMDPADSPDSMDALNSMDSMERLLGVDPWVAVLVSDPRAALAAARGLRGAQRRVDGPFVLWDGKAGAVPVSIFVPEPGGPGAWFAAAKLACRRFSPTLVTGFTRAAWCAPPPRPALLLADEVVDLAPLRPALSEAEATAARELPARVLDRLAGAPPPAAFESTARAADWREAWTRTARRAEARAGRGLQADEARTPRSDRADLSDPSGASDLSDQANPAKPCDPSDRTGGRGPGGAGGGIGRGEKTVENAASSGLTKASRSVVRGRLGCWGHEGIENPAAGRTGGPDDWLRGAPGPPGNPATADWLHGTFGVAAMDAESAGLAEAAGEEGVGWLVVAACEAWADPAWAAGRKVAAPPLFGAAAPPAADALVRFLDILRSSESARP